MAILRGLIPVLSWLVLDFATGILLMVPLRYRLLGLPAILLPAMASFRTMRYLTFPAGLEDLWGVLTLGGFIHFSSLLYLKRWTLQAAQRTEPVPRPPGAWLSRNLCKSMYKAATNPRFIRVQYKDIVIPDKSKFVKSTAIHRNFSTSRIYWLLLRITIFYIFNANILDYLLKVIPPFLLPYFIRIWFTINGFGNPILLLDSIHTLLAVLFIYVLRTDTPDEWLDLFGSLSEAYTIGRFWNIFWHRIHLSADSDYANLFISVLPRHINRHAIVRKVLMVFSIFMISGVAHQITSMELQVYPECSDYADVKFYSANAVAVLLEPTLWQLLSHRSSMSSNKGGAKAHSGSVLRPSQPSLILRLLGYAWVATFLCWITPTIYYPRTRCVVSRQLAGAK